MDVRIKVLKTEFYEDIADEYLSEGRAVGPCPILKEGDTFLYKSGEEAVMPEGFCPWAWAYTQLFPAGQSIVRPGKPGRNTGISMKIRQ